MPKTERQGTADARRLVRKNIVKIFKLAAPAKHEKLEWAVEKIAGKTGLRKTTVAGIARQEMEKRIIALWV